MPTRMEHAVLSAAGDARRAGAVAASDRVPWAAAPPPERTLLCAACHASIDPHQAAFGTDCPVCHRTATWRVPGYAHPSFRSTECAECHVPPPSHGMEHFSMVSRKLSGHENARVDQCFLCHDTTSWNDIRGKGRIKHH